MASLHSKKEHAQFKGPLTSDNYNKRIEALYKDLTYQYNKIGVTEDKVIRAYQRMLKQQYGLTKALQDLESRVRALETDLTILTFSQTDVDDTSRFASTSFEVPDASKCFQSSEYGLVLLPKIEDGSISKLTTQNSAGTTVIPSGLETRVSPVTTSADGFSALIDTSPVEDAVLNRIGYIWERNVVVTSTDSDGAILDVYVQVPQELSTTADCNMILINAFPIFSCDILNIAVSTNVDIVLNDNDDYVSLNPGAIHNGDADSVGWIVPGGWSGDTITNAGPKAFYFDPQPVTAFKVRLRQKNYFVDSGKYIYTYGMSALDARNDKFTNTGKIIFRLDAPEDGTISVINSVIPQIWNVAEAEIPDIFSYRVIWETSFDSNIYTLTPVSLSSRAWIEVTLNKTTGGGTPSLSGLVVDYA